MKKQINPALPAVRKLTLNKKTIANLNTAQMRRQIGGGETNKGCSGNCSEGWCTFTCYNSYCGGHGHTCNKPCGY